MTRLDLAGSLLDLRSDTVTQPTRAMRSAMANAEVGDDVLDGDPTVRRLEAIVAERLGKERALFFPSGTMANQAAVLAQTTPGTELLVDADAHLVHWELAGVAALGGVQLRLVKGAGAVASAADFARSVREPSDHAPEPALLSVENTHNGAGGKVLTVSALGDIAGVARMARVPLHLDGARLWNASVATGTSLAEFAAHADSVMVSFSKGLGAPVGAMLAGSAPLLARVHRIRKRLGGGMRQSGILAAGALYALEHHLASLADDHASARELASIVGASSHAVVTAPDTNIVMIDLPYACAADVVAGALSRGLRISAWHRARVRAVTHRDAPPEQVHTAATILREVIDEVCGTCALTPLDGVSAMR